MAAGRDLAASLGRQEGPPRRDAGDPAADDRTVQRGDRRRISTAPRGRRDRGGSMKLLLANGPNLNTLASREPAPHHTTTLAETAQHCRDNGVTAHSVAACRRSHDAAPN